MKTKKALAALLVLLLCFAVISATLANRTVEERSRSEISTGKVEISISDSTGAYSGRITSDGIEFTNILPGQTAERIVTIRNDAEKCHLRVKVAVTVDPAPNDGSDPERLIVPNVDSSEWNYEDGYYYYYKPLETGDEASMFDKVMFAPTIGNAYMGTQVKLTVTAEATQFKNNETLSADSWPESGGTA